MVRTWSRGIRSGLVPLPVAAGLLGAALLLGVQGCDPNSGTTLLIPTGGPSGGDCESDFTTIQMVGDFTNPPFSIPASPSLIEVSPCVWRVTVTLQAQTYLFKFVTDGAFDTPPDYGGSESVTLSVPGGPHATMLVTGTGTAIKVQVASPGDYTFTLDEQALTWRAEAGAPPPTGGVAGTVSFAGLSSPPFPAATVELFSGANRVGATQTDRVSRAFAFSGLAAGSYRVVASASCFTTVEIPSVAVGASVVNVGDVALAEGNSSFTTIDLVGGFNAFTIGTDPMIEAPPCVWTRERILDPGVYFMKFVTDGAFDTPPDYGGDESVQIPIPGGGEVRPVSGPGTAIKIEVANSGTYRFILDERLQRWDAVLVRVAARAEGVR